MDALIAHRLQFAFTVSYHYLFPQLTMGLALLIVVLKTLALRGDRVANESARFWAKIFGLSFVMGVVTGIPLEFQFGTNWARFSEAAGGVIGQTLAMEGVFAFFLESSFLYLLLFGEKRLGPKLHWLSAVLVCVGSWMSGYFIVCTNAFMQHPVGHRVRDDGAVVLQSLGAFLTNPWALVQYVHTMIGAVVTGAFVMAAIGAFYLLSDKHLPHARKFLRVATISGALASVALAFPTGDVQAKMVASHQPVTFAAMEGHFETSGGVGLILVGQPNMETLTLDNPLIVPKALSFLTYRRWDASIEGLTEFDRDLWPDNIPLLYYAYHIMVGLGTIFIAIMGVSVLLLRGGRLFRARWMLWILLLALPFPFIANTAGWLTAELGRQPWVLYDVMRTAEGYSHNVSSGNVLFTLLGFMGLYALLSLLFAFLFLRILERGPESKQEHG
ncbi:MAG: cytochrome ubiquinol oxidase subunit I [Myxococcales bacterium]|jgi:cytochrome d ubiquinol oxidase subunit I